jgi:ribosomal protein L37E
MPPALLRGNSAAEGNDAMNNSTSSTPGESGQPRLVTCRRCGEKNLYWQKSFSGRGYLTVARRNPDGSFAVDRRAFHK